MPKFLGDFTGSHDYPRPRTSGTAPYGACVWCSRPPFSYVFHVGGVCSKVKSIEYYPDGTIKKVTFKGEEDASTE